MHMSSHIAAAILAFCASRVGSVPVAEVAVQQAPSSLLDTAATGLVTGAATSGVIDGSSIMATATAGLSDTAGETGLAVPTGSAALPSATSENLPGNVGVPGPGFIPNGDDGPFNDPDDDEDDDADDGPRGEGECRGRPRRNRPHNGRPFSDDAGVVQPSGLIPTVNNPTGVATGAPTAATGGIGNAIETSDASDAIFVPSSTSEASAPVPTGPEGALFTDISDTASILPIATDAALEEPTGTASIVVRQVLQEEGPVGPSVGQFDGQIPPEIASRIPATVLQQISAGNFPTAIPESVRTRFANGERPTDRPGGLGFLSGGNLDDAGPQDITGSRSVQFPEETQVANA